MIREAVARYGSNDWTKVCQKLRSQHITPQLCEERWENVLRDQTVKGPWSEEEDAILRSLVEKFGPKKWSTIASYINGRIGKQCRERWLNHLSPAVSKDVWTEEEDEILINAQIQMGNKWSYISKLLPGRSENAVKNRYNSIASRNGVRKKRLGNFVNRSVAARNNLLRLQSLPKPHAGTDSPYAELLEKASQAISRRQRPRGETGELASLGALGEPFVAGSLESMNGQSMNGQSMNGSMNGQSMNGSMNGQSIGGQSIGSFMNGQSIGQSMNGQSIGQSMNGQSINQSMNPSTNPSTNPPSLDPSLHLSLDPSLTPSPSQRNSFLFDPSLPLPVIDTSDMQLPDPARVPPPLPPRSLQEEEATLQQIDSFLLAGNTLGVIDVPQTEEPLAYGALRDSFPSNDLLLPAEIPPVKLRASARVGTLNRGVYSSWDKEGSEGTNGGASRNSMSMRSSKYGSLDLLRLLNEADNDGETNLQMLGAGGPLFMEEEVPLADMPGGFYS